MATTDRATEAPLSGPGASGLDGIDWAEIDFLDLGSSKGGSIEYCRKRFEAGRGIGADLNERKVEQAKHAGFQAVRADAADLKLQKRVRFVSMMQFLEHLPDLATVERVINSAAASATDFLFIHHPSFEGEEYLSGEGLRQYWWHWRGHPAHVRVADYCNMLDRAGLRQYAIRYIDPITDSSHSAILPDSAPIDQLDYDHAAHGSKPFVRFPQPLWRFQEIFVALKTFEPAEWRRLTAPR
jgi:hypothetical protein